jgi:phosphoserine phosphatase RsbU/P
VQHSLLPDHDPDFPHLDVAGRTKYCDATGGDYFDFIDISSMSPDTVLLALGDVMGHGVASALLMASARAALRAHAEEQGSLAQLMMKVNGVLSHDARHQRFMTMALVAVNAKAGSVRWASAGHDPTVVYFPEDDRFEELEGGDIPLGMMENVLYDEYRRDGLTPGCILLIGTDGIWEMRVATGEYFGKQRLLELVRAHARRSAREIADALEIALGAWRGKEAAQDDVTFVIAKIR